MADSHDAPLPAATFHILIALLDRDRHGYGIIRDVAQRTEGAFRLGPATLYTSIHRMLAAGLIEESDGRAPSETEDSRRRYYRITPRGRRAATAEVARLQATIKHARARSRSLKLRT